MSSSKKKGLGRGLDALLGSASTSIGSEQAQQTLAVARLKAGKYQPRQGMDQSALEELADSIRAQGVMQPLLVRSLGGVGTAETFEIIAGERRFRAAQMAGLTEVPVLIRQADDQAALAMALIENLQRQDLSALEEAQGIDRLIREFGLTHEQAAQAVGRSRSATSNLLRLLQLPEAVQDMMRAGVLEAGHARALLPLSAAQQRAVAERVSREKLSVRDAERLVTKVLALAKTSSKTGQGSGNGKKAPGRDWTRVEEQLSDALGLPVFLKPGAGSKGELQIKFSSFDELDGLIERLMPGGVSES